MVWYDMLLGEVLEKDDVCVLCGGGLGVVLRLSFFTPCWYAWFVRWCGVLCTLMV